MLPFFAYISFKIHNKR